MGFFSEIKKLLFVSKSVSKSAKDKGVDYGKEKVDDFMDISQNVVDDLGQKSAGLRDSVLEGAVDLKNKGFQTISDVKDSMSQNETVQQLNDSLDNLGETVVEASGKVYDQLEDVGEVILDKAKDASLVIGAKANEIGGEMKEKYDELLDKAQKQEAYEKANPTPEFAETPIDMSESLLKDTDDFFEKANRYAEGNYKNTEDPTVEIEEISLLEEPDTKADSTPGAKVKAAGFEDRDGDGDEIIDDAIIISDE